MLPATRLLPREEGGVHDLTSVPHRSAMKLANLDHVFNITTACGRAREMAAPARPLTFVDLCGGPGGFTEYLLRCCDARGWGMSLTEEAGANGCDWRLDHVSGVVRGGSSETARPAARDPSDTPTTTGSERAWRFKQVLGQDGTGDIYNEDNIAVLAKEVGLSGSGPLCVAPNPTTRLLSCVHRPCRSD